MSSSTATATKPAAGGKGGEAAEAAPKKGKLKLILIVVVALVVVGGAAYWFLLKPSGGKSAPAKVVHTPGTVVTVDPISVNLADGHYLKIGIALQEDKSVKESVDGSRALDAVISLYSNQSMASLSNPAQRDAVKKQLVATIAKDYDGEVYDVYFTSYVMQ